MWLWREELIDEVEVWDAEVGQSASGETSASRQNT